MKVFRFEASNLTWGENILLIAADDIDGAKKFLPDHHRPPLAYEHECIAGLTYDGGEGIIENFYWEE